MENNPSTSPVAPFGLRVEMDLRELDVTGLRAGELADHLHEHGLLVFPGQELDVAAQRRVLSVFGPVLGDGRDTDYVSTDPAVGQLGSGAIAFHSDLSFSPEPFRVLSLHAVDVTDGASTTWFSSGIRVFDQLDAAARQELEGASALQVYPADRTRRARDATTPASLPRHVHPAIGVSAAGHRYVYLPEATTDRIVGLDADLGEALLQEVFALTSARENVYEHRWRRGDLVIWDNRMVVHGRPDQQHVGVRTLQRVVCAPLGFAEQHPELAFRLANVEVADVLPAPTRQ